MLKKTARILKKTLKITAIVTSLLIALTLVVLYTGDKAVPFVANYISKELSSLLPQGADIKIGEVKVGAHSGALDLTMQSVSLVTNQGSELDFKDIVISIDFLAVIPFLGHNLINVEFTQPDLVYNALKSAASDDNIDASQLSQYLATHFKQLKKFKFKITNTNFYYEVGPNQISEIIINELSFAPYEKGNKIVLHGSANFTINGKTTAADVTLSLSDDNNKILVNGLLKNISGSVFSHLGFGGEFLKEATLEADLRFDAQLSSLKKIDVLNYAITNFEGRIIKNSYFDDSFDLGQVSLIGSCNNNCMQISLDKLSVASEEINLAGNLQLDLSQGKKIMTGSFVLEGLEIDNIAKYWPNSFGQRTKDWIFSHIKGGQLSQAKIDLILDLSNPASITVDDNAVKVSAVLEGTSISYMDGVPAVLNVDANINSYGDNIDFTVKQARILDSTLSDVDGKISDLAYAKSKLELKANINGGLSDLISLAYVHAGISEKEFASASGNAATKLHLQMPLTSSDLELKDFQIDVTTSIEQGEIKSVFGKYDLSSATLTGSYLNHIANISGDATLNEQFPIKLKLTQNFINKARDINVQTRMSWDSLEKFGFAKPEFLNNFVDMGITISEKNGEKRELFEMDLTNTTIFLKQFGIMKALGEPGKASFAIREDQDNIYFDGYKVVLNGLVSSGSAVLNKNNNELVELVSPATSLGASEFKLDYKKQAGNLSFASISGDSLDISSFKNVANNSSKVAGKSNATALKLETDVNKLIMKGNVVLNKPQFALNCVGVACSKLEIAGNFDSGATMQISLDDNKISGSSADAGLMLTALGVTNKIRQGKLNLSGQYASNSLRTKLVVDDFYLKKTPSVMKLLGLISLTNISFAGIENILSSNGIDFDNLLCNINYNKGVAVIESCRLVGPSMTIVAKGSVDLNSNQIDILGSIFPNSLVNTLVKYVPIVGKVLSGDNDAFLGVNFRISGDADDPNVSSNPLSIFTPGELRNLIFQ